LGIRQLANPQQALLTQRFVSPPPGMVYHECGAVVVRFFRNGKPYNIIIDDRLPVANNDFALSHCRRRHEMWLPLLEKAYARYFGCYEAIEAGLISQALSDLSNGAPDTIPIKGADGQVSVNQDQLWATLEDAFQAGYLVGAGSNTGSDTTEVQGIAQGHAYMLVRIYTAPDNSEKLLQLQNPHGHGEWSVDYVHAWASHRAMHISCSPAVLTCALVYFDLHLIVLFTCVHGVREGDWSDHSPKWTQWWRNTLGYQDVDDGKFWMSYQDFLQMYQNVYICRLLPFHKPLASEWRGPSAAGPQSPWHNPTFTLTVKQATKVWIVLEQEVKRGKRPGADGSDAAAAPASANGYAFIQFFVVLNGGTRVRKIVREEIKGCANKMKMVNDREVGAEVYLDSPDTPYTIVCVTNKAGVEGKLTLNVFLRDAQFEFVELPKDPDGPPPA
jgi:hypothetical protein